MDNFLKYINWLGVVQKKRRNYKNDYYIFRKDFKMVAKLCCAVHSEQRVISITACLSCPYLMVWLNCNWSEVLTSGHWHFLFCIVYISLLSVQCWLQKSRNVSKWWTLNFSLVHVVDWVTSPCCCRLNKEKSWDYTCTSMLLKGQYTNIRMWRK